MNLFSEHRLLSVSLDTINSQRAAAGVSPVSGPVNARAAEKADIQQTADHQQVVAGQQTQGAKDRFYETQDYFRANPDVLAKVDAENKADGNRPVLQQAATGAGNTIDWATRLKESADTAEKGVWDYYNKIIKNNGKVNAADIQRDIQTARGNASSQIQIQQKAQDQYTQSQNKEAASSAAASQQNGQKAAGSKQPFGNRTSEEGKAANAAAGAKKTSTKSAANKTAFDTYLATLTPEQRALVQPIQIGLAALDQTLAGVADSAGNNLAAAESAADESFARQSQMLGLAQQNLEANKSETQDFLRNQMDTANQNLLQQRDQTKQWLEFQKQDETRRAEADKAKMVGDMAFAAAVTGGTYSSNANYAISAAEMQASQQISSMRQEYGLKAVDADMLYTSKYTELNNTFMQGTMEALQAYRTDSLNIMGMRFASEDARAKAKQTASENLQNTLNSLAMTKATGITNAMGQITETLAADRAATTALQQWKMDYTFKVDKDNRDFAFQQDTWQKNYDQKVQEMTLQNKALDLQDWQNQFAARSSAADKARGEVQSDRFVSQYETTYRPAWDQFNIAYSMPQGSAGRETALTSGFTQLLRGASQTDAQQVSGVLSALGMGSVDSVIKSFSGNSLTPKQVGEMHDVASAIYAKAQERRNDSVSKIMGELQKTNLQFTDDFFKITPEDVGIQTAPLSYEAVQTIDTLPPATKNKIVSYRLGKKDITTSYEMQLRLQEADRMFFADTGQHINVNESYRDSTRQASLYAAYQNGTGGRAAPPGHSMHEGGNAVDINPNQWKIAQPYLIKAGLKQLPASIDQTDAGHFSLTGQ